MSSPDDYWQQFFTLAGLPPAEVPGYVAAFVDNRMKPELLSELTRDVLADLGIAKIGDAMTILKFAKLVLSTPGHPLRQSTSGVFLSPPRKTAAEALRESLTPTSVVASAASLLGAAKPQPQAARQPSSAVKHIKVELSTAKPAPQPIKLPAKAEPEPVSAKRGVSAAVAAPVPVGKSAKRMAEVQPQNPKRTEIQPPQPVALSTQSVQTLTPGALRLKAAGRLDIPGNGPAAQAVAAPPAVSVKTRLSTSAPERSLQTGKASVAEEDDEAEAAEPPNKTVKTRLQKPASVRKVKGRGDFKAPMPAVEDVPVIAAAPPIAMPRPAAIAVGSSATNSNGSVLSRLSKF